MIGIIDYYLIPFALFLGATAPQIGLLVAIPNLVASVFQLFAVRAVHAAGNRLRLLVMGLGIQSAFLIPVGFLAYHHAPYALPLLILLTTVYKTIGGLITPAWGSLVSEYLPPHRRGHYFGWRSRLVGVAGVGSVCFWGLFLYLLKKYATQNTGFLILFLAAAAARLIGLFFMSRMTDLPLQRSHETEFTFWMFLRRFRESNFVRFVFYTASITFTTFIASPFFSVHMLRDLKFNYVSYMAVSMASVIGSLVSFPIWGRHADSVGNAKILKITSLLVPLIPILWLIPRHAVPLVIIELFSGVVWGGFNLCATNFIFDAVSPAKRVRCLGYFNLINGGAIFAGSLVGGFLAKRIPPFLGMPLLWLFVLSAAGRFLAHFLLSRGFTEVREGTKHVSHTQLFFSVVGIRPLFSSTPELNVIPPKSEIDFAPRDAK